VLLYTRASVRTPIVLLALAAVIVAGAIVAVVVLRSNDDSKGSPSASSWADSVCTSIDTWRTSITSLADVSGGTLTKDALREKLDDAGSATDKLVTDLQDLGAPDLEAGDQLKTDLNADADNLRLQYEALKSKAQDALDAGSATSFLSALAALATPFQSLVNQISTTLENLRSADNVSADVRAELQQAFDDSQACQKLRTQS
jgi:hypothetical protein